MDELRKNNAVKIEFNGNSINGTVIDYEHDRVLIGISRESIHPAREIKELDELCVFVHTRMGIKKMTSCVISKLNISNCIIIENNPAVAVSQKREYVRATSDLIFKIRKNEKITPYVCINISAGGIAFYSNSDKFEIGDKVDIILPEKYFGKNITAHAEIIKVNGGEVVARYIKIDKHDEDKILKYVFKLISEK